MAKNVKEVFSFSFCQVNVIINWVKYSWVYFTYFYEVEAKTESVKSVLSLSIRLFLKFKKI